MTYRLNALFTILILSISLLAGRAQAQEKAFGVAYRLTNYGLMVLEVAEGSSAEGVLDAGSIITKIDGLTTGTHISRRVIVGHDEVKQALAKDRIKIHYREPNIRDPYTTSHVSQAILFKKPAEQLKYTGKSSLTDIKGETIPRPELDTKSPLTVREKSRLGLMLYLGANGSQEVERGARLISEAAREGDIRAQLMEASTDRASGTYAERNRARSQRFKEIWEATGNLTALRYHAWSLGRKGTEASEEVKHEWFKRAADAGGRNAAREVGKYYFEAGDMANAVKYFSMAASKGEPHAMFFIAEMYYQGNSVKQDFRAALALFEKIEIGLYDHRGPKPESRAYQCKKVLGLLPPPQQPTGVRCPSCYGSGYVDEAEYRPNWAITPSAFAFKTRCRRCGGAGRVRNDQQVLLLYEAALSLQKASMKAAVDASVDTVRTWFQGIHLER